MMSCHDVSMLVSTGALGDATLMRRLSVRMHLAICRHCRAFRRQLEALGQAAREAGRTFEGEPSQDFESKIVGGLRRPDESGTR